MARAGTKELFSIYGKFLWHENQIVFVPASPAYYRQCTRRQKSGQKTYVTFSDSKAMRTPSQLKYHWVLMGLLSDHTGFTQDEMHDAVMRIKFGEKEVTLAGITTRVRKSISDSGRMSNEQCSELIEFDLKLCAEYEIRVPTREELGYLPEKKHHLVDKPKVVYRKGVKSKEV